MSWVNCLFAVASVVLGFGGLLLLVFPGAVSFIEHVLNNRWGEWEVFAIRLGLPGERDAEALLNRNVLAQHVEWDGVVRRHPRVVGLVLCLVATAFAVGSQVR